VVLGDGSADPEGFENLNCGCDQVVC